MLLLQVFSKRTYLCAQEYDEGYMDWHCLPGGQVPKNGSEWYTVCGMPFENHIEYIIVVTSFALFGFFMYMQMLRSSGKQIKPKAVVAKKHKTT